MKTPLVFIVVALVSVLAPAVALAHPGHGHGSADEVWHYLSEPVHVALAVGAAVVALGAIAVARWRLR